MKKTFSKLLIFLFLLIPAFCFGQKDVYLFSYFVDNGQDGLHFAYSHDGLSWEKLKDGKSFLKPEIGVDKLMRDPCIIRDPNGTFQMVWTSGWHDKIIGYASSKDLIHWSEQKAIPVMEHEPEAKNSWAPEVFYDDKKQKFLIFWATTIPGRHSDIADSEKEKGLNHRIYCTETADFKEFTKTKLFFNPDFSAIDATILKDGKSYFMFVKNENPNPPQKNIRVVKSNRASSFSTNVSAPITGNFWAEGPTALRIGQYVYVYFDKYRDHKYGAIRSKHLKAWKDVSDKVNFPKGMRHGTVFKVSEMVFKAME